jgi:ABC-type Mn2+/Zn2+ transport system permease subunit
VSFVRVAGVLLTFAYLIVPAVCAVMLARDWMSRMIVGTSIATAASLIGLWASYSLDLPTGAAVVCACGLLLVVVGVFHAARAR